MKDRARGGFAALLLVLFVISLPSAASAALIQGQVPCGADAHGFCGTVAPGSHTLRAFVATFPGKGTALVRFHGGLICQNSSKTTAVLDLQTQIVTTAAAAPSLYAAGGLRIAGTLRPAPAANRPIVDSYSLESNRLVAIKAAGKRSFYLRESSLRLDANAFCRLQNASFSIEFVPAGGPQRLVTSGPCQNTTPTYCFSFSTGGGPTSRAILGFVRYTPPAAGRVRVIVNAVAYCSSSSDQQPFVRLVTQILSGEDAEEPGGLEVDYRPFDGQSSDTFNLASERTFNVPKSALLAADFTVRYEGGEPGISCFIYNAATTILFEPTSQNNRLASQPPCKDANGLYCKQFVGSQPVPLIQRLKFHAPAHGIALVSFNGSLVCENSDRANSATVDLVGQIVTNPAAVPSPAAASGEELYVVVPPGFGGGDGSTDALDLETSRVLPLAAGDTTFYFKLAKRRVNSSSTCTVYNGAFTVHFVRS